MYQNEILQETCDCQVLSEDHQLFLITFLKISKLSNLGLVQFLVVLERVSDLTLHEKIGLSL